MILFLASSLLVYFLTFICFFHCFVKISSFSLIGEYDYLVVCSLLLWLMIKMLLSCCFIVIFPDEDNGKNFAESIMVRDSDKTFYRVLFFLSSFVAYALSPSYFSTKCALGAMRKEVRGRYIKVSSYLYLLFGIALLVQLEYLYYILDGKLPDVQPVFVKLPVYFAWIRIIQLILAFYFDVEEKLTALNLRNKNMGKNAKYALISYLELAICFSFVHLSAMYQDLKTPFQSLYFSVVTITTLGYGDIIPGANEHPFSLAFYYPKVNVILESLFGLFLLVVGFAFYLNNAQNDNS